MHFDEKCYLIQAVQPAVKMKDVLYHAILTSTFMGHAFDLVSSVHVLRWKYIQFVFGVLEASQSDYRTEVAAHACTCEAPWNISA